MRRLGIVTVITALLLPAWAHRAEAVQRLIDVRQIATDTLRDVALATFVVVVAQTPSRLGFEARGHRHRPRRGCGGVSEAIA